MSDKVQQKCGICCSLYPIGDGTCGVCGGPSIYNDYTRNKLVEAYQKPFDDAKGIIEHLREEGYITQEQTVNLLWCLVP